MALPSSDRHSACARRTPSPCAMAQDLIDPPPPPPRTLGRAEVKQSSGARRLGMGRSCCECTAPQGTLRCVVHVLKRVCRDKHSSRVLPQPLRCQRAPGLSLDGSLSPWVLHKQPESSNAGGCEGHGGFEQLPRHQAHSSATVGEILPSPPPVIGIFINSVIENPLRIRNYLAKKVKPGLCKQ